jgi:hypothetical protein
MTGKIWELKDKAIKVDKDRDNVFPRLAGGVKLPRWPRLLFGYLRRGCVRLCAHVDSTVRLIALAFSPTPFLPQQFRFL